jgi:hypothetical protein
MKEVSLKDAKLLFKKQSHGLKNLKKVNMNGKRFTMRLVCNIKNKNPNENMFCSQGHLNIPRSLGVC